MEAASKSVGVHQKPPDVAGHSQEDGPGARQPGVIRIPRAAGLYDDSILTIPLSSR